MQSPIYVLYSSFEYHQVNNTIIDNRLLVYQLKVNGPFKAKKKLFNAMFTLAEAAINESASG